MVGLVIVSHSKLLADALASLARQVSAQPVCLAVAAGAGVDHADFGTDAVEIANAIRSVYSPEGVLVLMDIGSAVLSAEMALDFLPMSMRSGVRLCPAPLVEGIIAAAVQAGLGSDLDTVHAEALNALSSKVEHLGIDFQGNLAQPEIPLDVGGSQKTVITLTNPHGLHARVAARVVQAVGKFEADVMVENLTTRKGPVSARSLNALISLGADEGNQVVISAWGPQAAQALQAFRELMTGGSG
jgi:dihydroxyacetone kinase phosphotransfer subunit